MRAILVALPILCVVAALLLKDAIERSDTDTLIAAFGTTLLAGLIFVGASMASVGI